MSYNPLTQGVPQLSRAGAAPSSNHTGVTLTKGTPVRMTASGAATIDVSNEAQANSIAGVVRTTLANGAAGEIITSGTIEDVATGFSVGSVLYVAKDGTLTDQKPTAGSNGFDMFDWVIRVGVLVVNVNNPSLQDLLVNIQIVGEL